MVSSTCWRIDMVTAYADNMIAHQGGWDEFLYAGIPIALIFALLRLANSRAKKLTPQDATNQPEPD
jgi:hypothetical protein